MLFARSSACLLDAISVYALSLHHQSHCLHLLN